MKKARKKSENNIKELKAIRSELELSLRAEFALSDAQMERIFKSFSLLSHQLFTDAYNIYKCAESLQTNCDTLTYAEAEQALNKEFDKDVFDIFSCFFEDRLYVKMPLPPHQFSRWENSIAKSKYGFPEPEYYRFFRYSVARSILYESGFHEVDTTDFYQKHMSFLFVISPKRNNLIDSDNYDTKSITDAITEFLPVRDSASCCAFSYATAITDDLPEGAYIIVSPSFDSYLTKAENLSLWSALKKVKKP